MRVLDREGIAALLDAARPRYRLLLATALFTGLRLGELLGLTWADIDLKAGVIRVRKQLAREGNRVKPKTPRALRDVILMPALAHLLREHRLASPYSQDEEFVFASARGTPLLPRNVERRGLHVAAEGARLNGNGRPNLRFHDCRHTFASLLIAEGLNVVYVSHQLGHADPAITLRVYAHLFDAAEHAQRATEALEARFGKSLASSGGNGGERS